MGPIHRPPHAHPSATATTYNILPAKTGALDAVHSGFQKATGEIFVWLNADDVFLPGAVRTAAQHLAAHPEIDVVNSEGNWIDENGNVINRYPMAAFLTPNCSSTIALSASRPRTCARRLTGSAAWIRISARLRSLDSHGQVGLPPYLDSSVSAGLRMHRGAQTISEREDVFQACMRLASAE